MIASVLMSALDQALKRPVSLVITFTMTTADLIEVKMCNAWSFRIGGTSPTLSIGAGALLLINLLVQQDLLAEKKSFWDVCMDIDFDCSLYWIVTRTWAQWGKSLWLQEAAIINQAGDVVTEYKVTLSCGIMKCCKPTQVWTRQRYKQLASTVKGWSAADALGYTVQHFATQCQCIDKAQYRASYCGSSRGNVV